MGNTFSSRNTLKTKLLAAINAANTADKIVKLSRSIEKANLDDDADLETALDTKVSSLAGSAEPEDLEKLAFGVKKLRTPEGAGVPTSTMVAEGSSNLYVTQDRVRGSFSASGDLSYNSGTGVLSYTALPDALTVYATVADLPSSGVAAGAKGIVEENKRLYVFTGASWVGVGLVDQKPSFDSNPDGSYALSTGEATVITLSATDPQGDPITYSHQVTAGALGGSSVAQSDNVFTITGSSDPADTAPFSITFSASDGTNVSTTTPSEFTISFAPDFSGHSAESAINGSYYFWDDAEGVSSFDEYDAIVDKNNSGKAIRAVIIKPRTQPNNGIDVNLGTVATLKGFVTLSNWTSPANNGSNAFGGLDWIQVFNVDTNQWETVAKNSNVSNVKYGAPSLFTAGHSTTNNDPAWAYGETGVRISKIRIRAREKHSSSTIPSNTYAQCPRAIFPIFG
tara:strand:- start:45 stop:1403 length:1359 start_codon:yes stop_codon:yes gene_type:complete